MGFAGLTKPSAPTVLSLSVSLSLFLSLFLALLPGTPAAAQEPAPPPAVAVQFDGGGWLGLGLEWTLSDDGDAEVGPRISRVLPGGPAARAGLRTGDVVVGLDGRSPLDPSALRRVLTRLRPGDEVAVRVLREGRPLELRMRAGSRPASIPTRRPPHATIRIDSITATVLRDLDSLRGVPEAGWFRVRADEIQGEEGRFRFRTEEVPVEEGRFRAGVIPGSIEIGSLVEGEVGEPVPFSVFLVASQQGERLRNRMKQVASRLASVERQMGILERRAGASPDPAVRQTLERIEAQAVQLRAAHAELQSRLRRVAEEEIRSAEVREIRRRAERAGHAARAPRPPMPEVRPLTPYIVGRDFLAGAEVVPLNDRLGRYFGVEEGVLVTRVADGTPARESGLAAGDVIVGVGDAPVRTPRDLRRLVGGGSGVQLTVVRESERIRIRLPD